MTTSTLSALLAAAYAESDPAQALPLFAQAADAGADGGHFWKMFGFHALAAGSPHAAMLLERALALAPQDAEILAGLGAAAEDAGQPEHAAVRYRAALTINPRLGAAAQNLGLVEMRRRDLVAAADAFDVALAGDGADVALVRSHLLACCFMGANRPAEITQRLTIDWARDCAAGVKPAQRRPLRPGLRTRPLRVGVMCERPDDRHFISVIRPILIGLRNNGAEALFITRRQGARAAPHYADLNVSFCDLSDATSEQVVAHLVAAELDVLATPDNLAMGGDAATYMARPAALGVQVCHTYLHYSGMMFDALAVDSVVSSDLFRSNAVEALFNLDQFGIYCRSVLEGRPSPAMRTDSDPICFGCFNRANKIDADTVQFWAYAMAAAPQARLFLSNGDYDQPWIREKTLHRLMHAGVDPARVRFRGAVWTEYEFLQGYDQVDVALDCVGFSGGLTSLDALLQGVPVVTAPTHYPLGRTSASFLTSLGLADLCVAGSLAEGGAKAAALLADRPRLAALRAELRPRVQASALFDADGFAASLLGHCRAWLLDRHPEAA